MHVIHNSFKFFFTCYEIVSYTQLRLIKTQPRPRQRFFESVKELTITILERFHSTNDADSLTYVVVPFQRRTYGLGSVAGKARSRRLQYSCSAMTPDKQQVLIQHVGAHHIHHNRLLIRHQSRFYVEISLEHKQSLMRP